MTPQEVNNWTYLNKPPRLLISRRTGKNTGTIIYSIPFSPEQNMTAHKKATAREAKWHPERFEPSADGIRK